jgi:hypothetical protein
MAFYFVLAMTLTSATHWVFERRLVAASRPSRRLARGMRVVLVTNVLFLPAALVLCLRAPRGWSAWAVPLGRVAFVDEGFCLLLLFILGVREVALVAARLTKGLVRRAPEAPDLDRRRALDLLRATGVAAAGIAVGLTAVAHEHAVAAPALDLIPLPITGLPGGLRRLRIAQISDLHVGPTIRGDTVSAIVARVNALAPDLVVITGDLVDGFVEQLEAEVAALAGLHAPLGCFFVTGNHEYFYRAEEWVEHLRGLGCTVLVNTNVVVERDGGRLLLAGICDESAGEHVPDHRQDLVGALAGAPEADARILLAHRPDCAPRAARLGFDAQLSGHLHGGQFFPVTALLRAAARYVAGLYQVEGMTLYVSRGAGYWGPSLRLGAPKEITLFELVERVGSVA